MMTVHTDYIAALSQQLAQLAERGGHPFLAYLLQMASEEAVLIHVMPQDHVPAH